MMFSRIARRHLWAFLLALGAAAAFLNAKAITALAASHMAPSADVVAASGADRSAKAAARESEARDVSADSILTRNPFEHGSSLVKSEPAAEGPGDAVPSDAPIPVCAGVRVHVITASTDPGWSFAALSSTTTPRPALYRRGTILDGKTVRFVGWDRVWLDQGGQLCRAELFGAPSPAVTATPAKPTPASPEVQGAPPQGLPPVIAKGIVKVNDTEFNIDRGALNAILENQQLLQSTRIQPENVGGRVAGVRLFGVKAGSLVATLGLQNGDRLDSINGFEIGSPEGALQAYARLRDAEHLEMKIERGGRETGMTYNVR